MSFRELNKSLAKLTIDKEILYSLLVVTRLDFFS
jgi:hypothetical protein